MSDEVILTPERVQTTRHFWVDNAYLQISDFTDGNWSAIPPNAVEVTPHPGGNVIWNGSAWEPRPPTSHEINIERDRRIEAGFTFAGKLFDFDMKAKTNISGAAQMAFMAIVAGAPVGFLKWDGGAEDFKWIADDNTAMLMDAQTVVAFGQAAASHERSHIMAARTLKDQPTIPIDYQNDVYWP